MDFGKNVFICVLLIALSLGTYGALTIGTTTICSGTACSAIVTLVGSDTLNCQTTVTSNNSWEDIGPFVFRFFQNTTNAYNITVYVNATNNTLTNASGNTTIPVVPATAVIKGDNWKCDVLVYNRTTWVNNGTNSSSVTVNNTAPTVTGVAISGIASTTITCSGTYADAVDSDAQSYSYYRWFKNSVVMAGNTTSTLNLATNGVATGDLVKCEMKVEDSGYSRSNSTALNSTAFTAGSTCYFGTISSQYHIVDMCSVLMVVSDLGSFVGDVYSPLITLMVLVIVLGAVLSIVGAILFTVFVAIEGSFKNNWK